MEAKITLSRITSTLGDAIRVSIVDAANRNMIVEVELSLESFAKAITGVGSIPGKILQHVEFKELENLGRKREIKNETCPKHYDRVKQHEEVVNDFTRKYSDSEWELFRNGVGTQQYAENHQYTVARYI